MNAEDRNRVASGTQGLRGSCAVYCTVVYEIEWPTKMTLVDRAVHFALLQFTEPFALCFAHLTFDFDAFWVGFLFCFLRSA